MLPVDTAQHNAIEVADAAACSELDYKAQAAASTSQCTRVLDAVLCSRGLSQREHNVHIADLVTTATTRHRHPSRFRRQKLNQITFSCSILLQLRPACAPLLAELVRVTVREFRHSKTEECVSLKR